jgi:hypothetical protein
MNVFLLKYRRNKFGLALVLSIFLFSLASFGQITDADTDSVSQSLLFRSHLLLKPNQLSPGILDSLKQNRIALAVLLPGDNVDGQIPDCLAQFREPYILVSEKKQDFLNKKFPKHLILNASLLEKYGSANQSTYLWMESLPDSMQNLRALCRIWEQKGRLPVFISAPDGKVMQIAHLVGQINDQQKIFGVVRNGDKLLAHVSWKDFPNRNTSGYFSFPIDESKITAFAPYKPGYRFSPDIILPSPENVPNLKVFNALPLDPDFGLTDEFHFPGKVKNAARNNEEEITLYGIEFARDPQKGECAIFSGKAYLDGGLKSRMALKPNFTITAWIKPTELGNNNCILGKGKNFVLKIHQGELTFTVQGIKDYYSAKTLIPENQWSFVSLVHSSAENLVRFYLNGEFKDEVKLLTPYTASDYTVLIGSNLWEEFFKGDMAEIKIWERELNGEEIESEYKRSQSVTAASKIVWIAGFILLSVILSIGLYFGVLRRKKQPLAVTPKAFTRVSVTEVLQPNQAGEHIVCFGGLKIFGSDGIDVSKKLSPKIKQLFVLILLHSTDDKKGISSKEMSDLLWPGMSPQNTKNIRGTNIQNLKALLSPCQGIKLVFQDKLWFFEFSDNYYIDFAFVQNWLREERYYDLEKLTSQLPVFLSILKNGSLFQNLNESWLDSYINQTSARIIEYGESLFHVLQEGKHDTLLLEVAEVISINDPLNEPALRKKISILTRQGKLGLAHVVFDNFRKLYFELYQEKYTGDFKTLNAGEIVH